MENYISTVLNKIKDEKVKADIQAELEDHYNERVEYYTRIGYDKETAEAKANEHFGNEAKLVGEQLDSMNRKNMRTNMIFTVVSILLFALMSIFLLAGTVFNTLYANTVVGIFFLLLFMSLALIELFVALRISPHFLRVLALWERHFSRFCLWDILPLYSSTISFLKVRQVSLSIFLIMTGNAPTRQ